MRVRECAREAHVRASEAPRRRAIREGECVRESVCDLERENVVEGGECESVRV